MSIERHVRAACLTPPVPGGVAVVQVVGAEAPALVNSLLQTSKPINLHEQAADRLRFCRLLDDGQVLDDVVVTVRGQAEGEAVVDISLHGGPRVVQRLLMLLKRQGTEIVTQQDLVTKTWGGQCLIETEGLEALAKAKSRSVALWVAHSMEQLPSIVEELVRDVNDGELERAHQTLKETGKSGVYFHRLLDGVRVVLTGPPNSGKSTLANSLAEREQAIVSELPGTTRDWVEHPAALHGIPFTFVDTAGLRESEDPIEQEAVERARQQVRTADVVLLVMDGSQPPPKDFSFNPVSAIPTESDDAGVCKVTLWALNKSDQGVDPGWRDHIRHEQDSGVTVSALTGDGLDNLGDLLISAAGLGDWSQDQAGIFTGRQKEAWEDITTALHADCPDVDAARNWFRCLKFGRLNPEESAS
jgi:tRNA modification GTPase